MKRTTSFMCKALLWLSFMAIVAALFTILCAAYWNYQETSRSMSVSQANLSSVIDTKLSLLDRDGTVSPETRAILEKGISEIELSASRALDSASISFLFEIFGIALIGIGVFLLSRCHNAVTMVEGSQAALAALFVDIPFFSAFESELSACYTLCHLLETGCDRGLCAPAIRDLVKSMNRELSEGRKKGIGMERRHRDLFLERAIQIGRLVGKHFPENEELKSKVTLLVDALKDEDWARNYLSHKKQLLATNGS